ncbi:MAG: hypothetical protein Kow0059_11670 [Candidatus Sumerlaeia bacterium]
MSDDRRHPSDGTTRDAEVQNGEERSAQTDGPEIIEIPADPQALAEAAAGLEESQRHHRRPAASDGEGREVESASAQPPPDSTGEEESGAEDDGEEPLDVPRVRDMAEARCVLEALLFTTVEPLPLKKLSALLPPLDPHTIRQLIVSLQSEYDAQRRGLQIMEVGKGFQMASRPEYGKWVLGLLPHRRKSALSTAALETLAIIAYKQPITRVEVDQIRGVDSSGTLRNLLDLGLVKAAGQKDVPGRPTLYITTDQFLKVFGLRRLTDLPSLQELRRRYKDAPPAPAPAAAADPPPAAAAPESPPHAESKTPASDQAPQPGNSEQSEPPGSQTPGGTRSD